MRKNKKDDIVYKKFKNKYSIIFNNNKLLSFTSNHFNKNQSFVAFVIGFLENQLGEEKIASHLRINKDEWVDLFIDFYTDKNILKTFEDLSLNPIIEYEEVLKLFSCFDSVINKLIMFFNNEQFNLNIEEFFIKQILKSGFGYVLYNNINCKIYHEFEQILADPEYDQKTTMILYNTKLFSQVKKHIVNNCKDKINDLITLILGLSQNLYLGK